MDCNNTLTDAELKAMFAATERSSNSWSVQQKEPNTSARNVPHSSPMKLHSSSTTTNLPSKSRNAPTVKKPSIALITWRST